MRVFGPLDVESVRIARLINGQEALGFFKIDSDGRLEEERGGENLHFATERFVFAHVGGVLTSGSSQARGEDALNFSVELRNKIG